MSETFQLSLRLTAQQPITENEQKKIGKGKEQKEVIVGGFHKSSVEHGMSCSLEATAGAIVASGNFDDALWRPLCLDGVENKQQKADSHYNSSYQPTLVSNYCL